MENNRIINRNGKKKTRLRFIIEWVAKWAILITILYKLAGFLAVWLMSHKVKLVAIVFLAEILATAAFVAVFGSQIKKFWRKRRYKIFKKLKKIEKVF